MSVEISTAKTLYIPHVWPTVGIIRWSISDKLSLQRSRDFSEHKNQHRFLCPEWPTVSHVEAGRMSVNNPLPDSNNLLTELPSFTLSYHIDDTEEPPRVTVYPDAISETTTKWISIDNGHAIDLADVA